MTNKEVIEAYTKTKESLNPILDELQEMNGFVSRNDIIEIANYLDISEKEIMVLLKYKKNIWMQTLILDLEVGFLMELQKIKIDYQNRNSKCYLYYQLHLFGYLP